ncbi:hypothetical protein Tco_1048032 [Tanacetum coccineum]
MQEAYNRNQEATIQLMKNQMGQMEEAFQEIPLEFEDLLYHDPSIDPPPIVKTSDSHHEEFADELAHIISPPDDSTLSEEFSEINPSLSFPFGNENKIFNLEILMVDGIHPFMRKSPHLPNDNFKIDKHHILSEISLKIESFHTVGHLAIEPFSACRSACASPDFFTVSASVQGSQVGGMLLLPLQVIN